MVLSCLLGLLALALLFGLSILVNTLGGMSKTSRGWHVFSVIVLFVIPLALLARTFVERTPFIVQVDLDAAGAARNVRTATWPYKTKLSVVAAGNSYLAIDRHARVFRLLGQRRVDATHIHIEAAPRDRAIFDFPNFVLRLGDRSFLCLTLANVQTAIKALFAFGLVWLVWGAGREGQLAWISVEAE